MWLLAAWSWPFSPSRSPAWSMAPPRGNNVWLAVHVSLSVCACYGKTCSVRKRACPMSSSLSSMHLPRRHIVPTHLNLPDQVLTLWSFSLTARQLLLLLVGAGLGGTLWQHLAVLGHYAIPGEAQRLLLGLLPFMLTLSLALTP